MKPYHRTIHLRHLFIDKKKVIGIRYFTDRDVQALVEKLPDVGWSEQYGMAYLPNKPANLAKIFETFRGVAWINTKAFPPARS